MGCTTRYVLCYLLSVDTSYVVHTLIVLQQGIHQSSMGFEGRVTLWVWSDGWQSSTCLKGSVVYHLISCNCSVDLANSEALMNRAVSADLFVSSLWTGSLVKDRLSSRGWGEEQNGGKIAERGWGGRQGEGGIGPSIRGLYTG